MECVRTMLADSKLPHRFWAEALSTAVYLRNRSPTKALEGTTPFEAWNGSKPDVNNLHIFGCSAYAHVPKAERQKLYSKTRKCVLLGYGAVQKGYRLYDLKREKIIHSRDVIFNESSMPGIQKEKVDKYVKLEVGENEPTIEEQGTPELTVSHVPNQSQHEEQVTHGSNTIDPPLRRSTRNRHEPSRYGYQSGFMASSEEHDPSTVREALSTPDKARWEEAMAREMESIHSNKVWELVEPPLNRKIVGSKWIFKQKRDAEGTVTQYKAQLVAQGCSQIFGLDYEETFSPVVRFESVRSMVALGAHYKLHSIKWTYLLHSSVGNFPKR